MKAILGDVCIEKLNLNDNNTLLQSYIVERINGNAVIENSESIALDFLGFKEFLESNIAPHETKYEEKRKNKKLSEEALNDIYYLYEEDEKGYKDSDTQPILEKVSLVTGECSEQINNAQGRSKQPCYLVKSSPILQGTKNNLPLMIFISTFAITGVALGIAIALHLEMVAVGIVVGTCCFAAAIVYSYSRPSSSLKNSNVQEKIARDVT